jgi:hypothetical protein
MRSDSSKPMGLRDENYWVLQGLSLHSRNLGPVDWIAWRPARCLGGHLTNSDTVFYIASFVGIWRFWLGFIAAMLFIKHRLTFRRFA